MFIKFLFFLNFYFFNIFLDSYELPSKSLINNINSNNNSNSNSNSNRLNHINDMIFEIERNIADLNRNYKNLMIKFNVSENLF